MDGLIPLSHVLKYQTTGKPNLFGTLITAYGGTSYHSPSIFTRYLLSLISYSTSSGFQPSAVEQQPSPKVLSREFAQALISGDVGPSCPWSAASAEYGSIKNRKKMQVDRML